MEGLKRVSENVWIGTYMTVAVIGLTGVAGLLFVWCLVTGQLKRVE